MTFTLGAAVFVNLLAVLINSFLLLDGKHGAPELRLALIIVNSALAAALVCFALMRK